MTKGPEMEVRGVIFSDLGKAALFTEIDWVKRQLKEKVGVEPYPGTLNLMVEDSRFLANLKILRENPGIEIIPEQENFCTAYCYKVLLEGRIPGAIIIPHVSDYPLAKLEIVAPVCVKETLKVKDGDTIAVTIFI